MNLKMKSIVVLNAKGKYANRPLERLTLIDLDTNDEYVLDAYCEDVSFLKVNGEVKMYETYSLKGIRKGESDYFKNLRWLLNDVYDNEHVYKV